MSPKHALLAASLMLAASCLAAAPVEAASCGQLWYARNAIFADAGYCFKTPEAIAAFGPRCYPPYGKLSRGQQARVNSIIAQERRKGCN